MNHTLLTLIPNLGGVNHCSLHCRLANYPWFDDRAGPWRFNLLKRTHTLGIQTEHIQNGEFSSQSQHHISARSLNCEFLPNDSVNYVVDPSQYGKVIENRNWFRFFALFFAFLHCFSLFCTVFRYSNKAFGSSLFSLSCTVLTLKIPKQQKQSGSSV